MHKKYSNTVVEAGVSDFLTPSFLLATLIPFAGAFFVLFTLAGFFFSDISNIAENGISEVITYAQRELGQWFGTNQILSNIISSKVVLSASRFLFVVFLGSFIFMASLSIQLIILGILTPWISRRIKKRYYPQVEQHEFGNIFTSIFYISSVFLIIIMAFIISLPLLFFPVIGFFIFHLLMFLLFKKLLVRDVASTILLRQEYKKIKSVNRMQLLSLTGLLYIIACIPLLGLFLQVLFASVLAHYFFREAEELRMTQSFLQLEH